MRVQLYHMCTTLSVVFSLLTRRRITVCLFETCASICVPSEGTCARFTLF